MPQLTELPAEILLSIIPHVSNLAEFSSANHRLRDLCVPTLFTSLSRHSDHKGITNSSLLRSVRQVIRNPAIFSHARKLSIGFYSDDFVIDSASDISVFRQTVSGASSDDTSHSLLAKITSASTSTQERIAAWILLLLHFLPRLQQLSIGPMGLEFVVVALATTCFPKPVGLKAITKALAGGASRDCGIPEPFSVQELVPWLQLPALSLLWMRGCTDTAEGDDDVVSLLPIEGDWKSPVTQLLFDECMLTARNLEEILKRPKALRRFSFIPYSNYSQNHTDKRGLKKALLQQKDTLQTLEIYGFPHDWGLDLFEVLAAEDGENPEGAAAMRDDFMGSLRCFSVLETLNIPTWMLQGHLPESTAADRALVNILPPSLVNLTIGSARWGDSGNMMNERVRLPPEELVSQLIAVVQNKEALFPRLEKIVIWGCGPQAADGLEKVGKEKGVLVTTEESQPEPLGGFWEEFQLWKAG